MNEIISWLTSAREKSINRRRTQSQIPLLLLQHQQKKTLPFLQILVQNCLEAPRPTLTNLRVLIGESHIKYFEPLANSITKFRMDMGHERDPNDTDSHDNLEHALNFLSKAVHIEHFWLESAQFGHEVIGKLLEALVTQSLETLFSRFILWDHGSRKRSGVFVR